MRLCVFRIFDSQKPDTPRKQLLKAVIKSHTYTTDHIKLQLPCNRASSESHTKREVFQQLSGFFSHRASCSAHGHLRNISRVAEMVRPAELPFTRWRGAGQQDGRHGVLSFIPERVSAEMSESSVSGKTFVVDL